jgi:hypothetical protein
MRSILIVRPGARDELNLADPGIRARFAFDSPDPAPGDADPVAYVEAVVDDPTCASVDGVFGSRDQTQHMAVHVADRLGLPGPSPESFMRCHDKLEARRWQQRIVPEATPRFAPLDPDESDDEPMPAPFFMKPTTGHLSQLAFTIHDRDELSAALGRVRRELDAVTWFDRRLEKGEYRRMLCEELLARRRADPGRRHRLGAAPERHQLPAVRLPQHGPGRAV